MAGLQSIPLQLRPPVLLAVHDWPTVSVVSMADTWGAPEGPAASDPDALEHRCGHLGLADLLQAEEIVQEDMLQLGGFLI